MPPPEDALPLELPSESVEVPPPEVPPLSALSPPLPAPSSSLGEGRPGLYEAIHGSAPDIAGTGRANPAATILSLAMLLRDLGEQAAAAAIEQAVTTVLDAGPVTPDLGGTATTQELGSAIARAVAATPHEVMT